MRRLLEKVNAKATSKPVTTLKIVATTPSNGAHKAAKDAPAAKRAPTMPKVETPPPAPPKKDLLSRALGF